MNRTLKKHLTLITLLLAGVIIAACAPSETPPAAADQGADYFDESCGDCHRDDGRAPSLAELRALSPEALRAGIRNHPTAGPLIDRFTADRMGELIEYLEKEPR